MLHKYEGLHIGKEEHQFNVESPFINNSFFYVG